MAAEWVYAGNIIGSIACAGSVVLPAVPMPPKRRNNVTSSVNETLTVNQTRNKDVFVTTLMLHKSLIIRTCDVVTSLAAGWG